MRTLALAAAASLLLAPSLVTAVGPSLTEPEPAACAPITGCLDVPGLVDEAGDTMSGQLFMQSNIVMGEGSRIDFIGDVPGVVGTSNDNPVHVLANNVLAMSFVPPGPPSDGVDGAFPSLNTFGDLSVGPHAVVFDGQRLESPSTGELTFAGDRLCRDSAPCGFPTATRRVVVSPVEFEPADGSTGFTRSASGVSGSAEGDVVFYAGLHVPDGAVITAVKAWAHDATLGSDLTLQLLRRALGCGACAADVVAELATSGDAGEQELGVGSLEAAVDLTAQGWALRASWPSDLLIELREVLIEYTIDAPLP